MENKKKVARMICVAFIISLAGGCAVKAPKATQNAGTDKTTVAKEKEYQSNLDVIRPQAYSTVDGLHLEKGTYLSVIGKADDTEYWKAVKAGVDQATKDFNTALGYKGEDKIKVNYSGPTEGNNVDEQINILDEELARYPSAVGIAAVDATACTVQFDLAAENHIPIVAFDSGSDYKNIISKCSTDNTAAAQTAATKLSDVMEDKGEVALFVHDAKSTTGMEREKAFIDEMKKNHPAIKIVKIYYMDEMDVMAKQIAQERSTEVKPVTPEEITQIDVAKYILEKNPMITGIYATSAEATQTVLKACEALKKEEMKIVAFDGGEEQLAALEKGTISGLIVQNPYGMGYATVVASARAVLGMGNEAIVDTGYTWVTKNNMDSKTISRMLY